MSSKVRLLDFGVFLEEEKALLFSDLHIGYEQNLYSNGVMLPKSQYSVMKKNILGMIRKTNPKKIIICGDLKHEFSGNSSQEWKQVNDMILLLKSSCKELILIRGNHDNYLQNILKKHGLSLLDHFETKRFMIVHGHEKIITRKKLIFGHEHPAITLKDEAGASHKYKCHLIDDKIIVMPSLNPLTFGFDVLNGEKPLSPLISDLENMKPVINGLVFPKIKQIIQFSSS